MDSSHHVTAVLRQVNYEYIPESTETAEQERATISSLRSHAFTWNSRYYRERKIELYFYGAKLFWTYAVSWLNTEASLAQESHRLLATHVTRIKNRPRRQRLDWQITRRPNPFVGNWWRYIDCSPATRRGDTRQWMHCYSMNTRTLWRSRCYPARCQLHNQVLN